MPSVSQKQHNAMEAAAHGKSTLGIPKSVGEDFSQADKGKKFAGGGPITAASIEAGGNISDFHLPVTNSGGGLTNPTPASSPEIKPISTTNTPPGGGPLVGPTNPNANGSGLTPIKGGDGGGLYSPGLNPSGPQWLKDGGMVPMPPTAGVSSSYPPPPGERKQGPRNYGKK